MIYFSSAKQLKALARGISSCETRSTRFKCDVLRPATRIADVPKENSRVLGSIMYKKPRTNAGIADSRFSIWECPNIRTNRTPCHDKASKENSWDVCCTAFEPRVSVIQTKDRTDNVIKLLRLKEEILVMPCAAITKRKKECTQWTDWRTNIPN